MVEQVESELSVSADRKQEETDVQDDEFLLLGRMFEQEETKSDNSNPFYLNLLHSRSVDCIEEETDVLGKSHWIASKETSTLVSSISKVLECPICLEMVTIPTRMCLRGHVTCASCTKGQTVCSICRQPLLQEQPTCLNRLLAVLPRQCCFKDEGCKVLFLPEEISHEQICPYRKTSCKHPGCGKDVKVGEMKIHYEFEHASTRLLNVFDNDVKVYFNLNISQTEYIPVSLPDDNNFFYVVIESIATKKNLKITFKAFFVEKTVYHYFVKVRFQKGPLEYTWTIQALIGESSGEITENSQLTMNVPQSVFSHFVNKNEKTLAFRLAFIKTVSLE